MEQAQRPPRSGLLKNTIIECFAICSAGVQSDHTRGNARREGVMQTGRRTGQRGVSSVRQAPRPPAHPEDGGNTRVRRTFNLRKYDRTYGIPGRLGSRSGDIRSFDSNITCSHRAHGLYLEPVRMDINTQPCGWCILYCTGHNSTAEE